MSGRFSLTVSSHPLLHSSFFPLMYPLTPSCIILPAYSIFAPPSALFIGVDSKQIETQRHR